VLSDGDLRREAARRNQQIIADRANYAQVMAAADSLYQHFLP
jgi:hypothetical protein